MTFGDAVDALKVGRRVRRTTWPDHVVVVVYDRELCTFWGQLRTRAHPFFWRDIASEDWEVVEP